MFQHVVEPRAVRENDLITCLSGREQTAVCSSKTKCPVGLKEIFIQHSTWTTGRAATTNRCCCQRNPNQPFKLFTAPEMPIPLQKKASHGFLFFFSRYWLFIQKASAQALSSPLSILRLSFYNLAYLKRCWRKASPQKSLLLLVKQKRLNSNIQQCCRQILSSTSSNDL